MKQTLLFVFLFLTITSNCFAKIHVVQVSSSGFSPGAFAMTKGDTVRWQWVSGQHTTECFASQIPPGATTWQKQIDSVNTSFTYVPDSAGNYAYNCLKVGHSSEHGSFIVNPTNITTVDKVFGFAMYPNPAKSVLHLTFNVMPKPLSVIITDMGGRKVFTGTYEKVAGADINIKQLGSGTYVLTLESEGQKHTEILEVR